MARNLSIDQEEPVKIAIVKLPHPPIGDHPAQVSMIDEAASNSLGSLAEAAEHEVIVAIFPDGQHHTVKNRGHEITVVNR
jgi:hypothetical protein